MSRYISIEEVIAGAKIRLRVTGTSAPDMELENYVLAGLRAINALDSYQMCQTTLPIVDGRAELPCGYHRFLTVLFHSEVESITTEEDQNGNDIVESQNRPPNFARAIYVDLPFLYQFGCDTTGFLGYQGTFSIHGNYIHFNSRVTATELILTYLSKNVDENGIVQIPQNYNSALTEYACWEYSRARPFSQVDPSTYTNAQIQSYYERWKSQRAYCIGTAVKEQAREARAEIMATVNALISNRNVFTKI